MILLIIIHGINLQGFVGFLSKYLYVLCKKARIMAFIDYSLSKSYDFDDFNCIMGENCYARATIRIYVGGIKELREVFGDCFSLDEVKFNRDKYYTMTS